MTNRRNSHPLCLLQLTDAHLKKEAGGQLLGINVRDSLSAVIAHASHCGVSPDYVIATGDIAQDGSCEAYEHFLSQSAVFDCPVYWLAGNHDSVSAMNDISACDVRFPRVIVNEFWVVVLLHSPVERQAYGLLCREDIDFIERVSSLHSNKHLLIALHHQPVPVGSVWLDNIGLKNSPELMAALKDIKNVKVLLWGHVHQAFDEVVEGVRCLASPSTCVQFQPLAEDFSIAKQSPGYRWLKLYADGTIDTQVCRAVDFLYQLDVEGEGY